jgi:hypothetical protein
MGAFFLFQNGTSFDEQAVRAVFEKKGFGSSREFAAKGATLWLYRKQLVEDDNYHFADPQTAVFATGTIVYRGKPYRESLIALLDDYRQDRLDWDEIIGSFCLIFFVGGRIRLLTDRLNIHHLFIDDRRTRISSSFLAMLASHRERLAINRLALYEKLATGYIVGPDTLVLGIRQVNDAIQEATQGPPFEFLPHPQRSREMDFCSGGFNACVQHQVDVLRDYFRRVGALAAQYGAESGLSAGYDSRLVFALCGLLPVRAAAHTHSNGPHHADEIAIARQLAELKGRELTIVPTRPVEDQDEADRARVLSEILYYFDGRCSDNSGSFSETYTPSYRAGTLGSRQLTFSGLGGEMYRNHYDVASWKVDFEQWMLRHVYYDFFPEMLPSRDLRRELHEAVSAKMASELETDLVGSVEPSTIHRFYSEVNQPQCEGAVLNAHNQVAFFLAPFTEYSVVREAYKAMSCLGLGGRFEAAMIARLDEAVADVATHGGYPLSKEPLQVRLRAAIKTYVPNRVWNWRSRLRHRRLHIGNESLAAYRRLADRSPVMREIEEALTDFAPELQVQACVCDSTARGTAIFVGSFLREFRDHLAGGDAH